MKKNAFFIQYLLPSLSLLILSLNNLNNLNAEERLAIIKYDDAKPGIYSFEVTEEGTLKKLSMGQTLDFTQENQPPNTTLEKKTLQVLQQINDPEKARKLAIAYSTVILSSDDFSGVQEIGKVASDAANIALEDDENWAPFRQFLDEEFTKAQRRGELNNVDDYVKLLTQVRAGLLKSLENAKLPAIDFQTIIDIVIDVLELFQGDVTLEKVLEIVQNVLELLKQI